MGAKFYLQLFAKIMIMAVFAMSLDLLVGYAGLVSFGHAAFFGIGAYTLWLAFAAIRRGQFLAHACRRRWRRRRWRRWSIGLLVLRCSGVYFIMVTLAFAQMFFYFAAGSKFFGGSDGVYIYVKPARLRLYLDLGDTAQFYYLALAAMAGTYLLLRVVDRHAVRPGVAAASRATSRACARSAFRPSATSSPAFALAGALAGLPPDISTPRSSASSIPICSAGGCPAWR